MLAVPIKPTEQADWYNPLLKYMAKNYSGKEVIEHTASLQRLNNMRTKAVASRASDESTLNAYTEYLRMLCAVQTRFPVNGANDEVMSNPELRGLTFIWSDAFKPSKSVTHHSMAYERPCVLFNYAALESHAGMVQDRATMEGIKLALDHFQRAAGVFQYMQHELAEKGKIPGPFTSDLSAEGLGLLYNLMMAQAQACYFEKAIRDKLRTGVLSKLAAQASQYYAEALRLANIASLAAVLDKAWTVHLEFQYHCFASSAEYQYARTLHAQAEESGSGYGEEIARLKRAEGICNKAIEHAKANKLPATMLTTVQHLLGKIVADKKKGEEDNAKIYMDTIPPDASLKPLVGAAIAKATPINKEFITPIMPGTDDGAQVILKGLLPPKLRDIDATFKSKAIEILNQSAEKVEKAAEDIRLKLAEAGLPASVESGDQTAKGLPQPVWNKITASLSIPGGGIDVVLGASDQNKKTAKVISDMLDKMEHQLKDEERADNECRSEFGTAAWKVPPSAEVNKPILADIERYRGLLAEATVSDDGLAQKINLSKDTLLILKKSKAELDAMLPAPAAENNPQVEELRLEVSLKLVDLGSKIQEIEQLQTNLVDEIGGDNIMLTLTTQNEDLDILLADKAKVNSLIESHLSKYRESARIISDRLLSIPRYFDAVLNKNFEFAAARTQTAQSREREAILAQIDAAITKYEELLGHMNQGRQFYVDLTAHVTQLESTTSDHLFVRDLQRNEMAAELRQAIEKVANSVASTVAASSAQAIQHANSGSFHRPSLNRQGSTIPNSSPYALSMDDASHYPTSTASTARAYSGSLSAPAIIDPIMRGKVEMMRGTLGLDGSVTDYRIQEFILGAKGDINLAINNYLENPNATFNGAAGGAANIPMAAAVPISGGNQQAVAAPATAPKKKGWLR